MSLHLPYAWVPLSLCRQTHHPLNCLRSLSGSLARGHALLATPPTPTETSRANQIKANWVKSTTKNYKKGKYEVVLTFFLQKQNEVSTGNKKEKRGF